MNSFNCLKFLSIIILAFLVAGCEKDDGIIQESKFLDNHDPGINISFINQTNINSLTETIKDDSVKLSTSKDLLENIKRELEAENLSEEDSIILATKKTTEEEKIKNLTDAITKNKADLAKLKEEKVIIKSLTIAGSPNGRIISFKEAKVFRFPLRPDFSVTEYTILLEGNTDEFHLSVIYDLETHVVDRVIKRKAENIEIGENKFKEFKLDTVSIIDEHLYKAYY